VSKSADDIQVPTTAFLIEENTGGRLACSVSQVPSVLLLIGRGSKSSQLDMSLRPARRTALGAGDVELPFQGIAYRASHDISGQYDWRPSIHMPRKYSRITLDIVSVRVERLQDISDADVIAEGTPPAFWFGCIPSQVAPPRQCYRKLWSGIHGEESWNGNPWVWVIEFKRVGE
jgi:hypothetical protein